MAVKDTTSDKKKVRVLIIDDEEIVHASVGRILSRAGFATEAVFSAQEGLERLDEGSYSLIITDLMMPLMNGIELLRALNERKSRVPVMMITGYPTISTALQAMRLGAMDYLAKPFTRKELLSPVQRALRLEHDDEPAIADGAPTLDKASLVPGTEVYLPHHSWARYCQDGVFEIGIEESFLAGVGGVVVSLSCPVETELADQGTIGIHLTTREGEEHGVAMPLTGQVMQINLSALDDPTSIGPQTWLLRLIPSQVIEEAGNLVLRSKGGESGTRDQ